MQSRQEGGGPAGALARAFGQLSAAINGNVTHFRSNATQQAQALGEQAAGFVQHLQQQAALRLQEGAAAVPMLASLTARTAARPSTKTGTPANPLFDLGYNPDEIKYRLAGVPVYAVVNAKNEFVLVSGDDGGHQLGLFFFTEDEATALVQTIKASNPKLGKQTRVMETSMDAVYEFAVTPRSSTDTEGVAFRFMPDPREVAAALDLYRFAGVPATGFQGVPLFQAEGLTVKGEKARYTPLFFSKDDLDTALGSAYSGRQAAAVMESRAKADRAAAELAEAQKELAATQGGGARKAAQRKVDQAQQRVKKYQERLGADSKKDLPRVDVGSLEEVIAKMETDEKGEWGDVIFIPAGALSSKAAAAVEEAAAAAAAAKGGGKK